MALRKILVTGATGGTGLPLVQRLLAMGFPVRALVRQQDARSASLAGQGAEVMVANVYPGMFAHNFLRTLDFAALLGFYPLLSGQVTGSPAESFETTARRYAALPFARLSARNRLTVLLKFLVTPLYPGHNFQRCDRQMRLPQTAQPTLCMDDPA